MAMPSGGSPSPIASLPPEILSLIFIEFANGLWCQHTRAEYTLSLLVLSQVCRFWRELALNMCSLWNKMVIGKHTSPEFFAILVKRAHLDEPISIAACMRNKPSGPHTEERIQELQSALRRTSPRLRHLFVVVDGQHYDGKIFDNFIGSGKRLETLHVEPLGSGLTRYLPFVHVPKDFLGAQAPPLTSLTLDNVVFHWESTFFPPGLTYLSLWSCRTYCDDRYWSSKPSLAQLLAGLAKLPLLRTLKLNWVPAEHSPLVRLTPVVLAHLRTFVLPDAAVKLLSYIRFRKTTAVTLCPHTRCSDSWQAYQQVDNFADLRNAILDLLMDTVVYAVSFDTDPSNGMRFWACETTEMEQTLAPLERLMDSPSLQFLHLHSMPPRVSLLNTHFFLTRDDAFPFLKIDLQHVRFADLRGGESAPIALQDARNLTALRLEGSLGIGAGTVLARRLHLPARTMSDEGVRPLAPRNSSMLHTQPRVSPATPNGWTRLRMVPRPPPRPTRAVSTLSDDLDDYLECWPAELLGCNEDHSSDLAVETSESVYGTSEPLFPHLRTLLIARVGIPSRTGDTSIGSMNWREPELDWQSHMLDVDDLLRAVRVRVEDEGADEVTCVEFENCSCAEEMRSLAPLIYLVPQVKWDRKRLSLE